MSDDKGKERKEDGNGESLGERLKTENNDEFAAEVAPGPAVNRQPSKPEEERSPAESNRETRADNDAANAIGWTALVLAIISLFVYPVFLGGASIVLGIMAYMQGSRSLGAWSVIIGGIAFISSLLLIPYIR